MVFSFLLLDINHRRTTQNTQRMSDLIDKKFECESRRERREDDLNIDAHSFLFYRDEHIRNINIHTQRQQRAFGEICSFMFASSPFELCLSFDWLTRLSAEEN